MPIDSTLVFLLVASLLAAYLGLFCISQMASRSAERTLWIFAGAVALGFGLLGTHFIAVQLWPLEVALAHDLPLMLFSWLATVTVCALALNALNIQTEPRRRQLLWAMLFGAALLVLHFSAISAIRIVPPSGFTPLPTLAAFLTASLGALSAVFILRPGPEPLRAGALEVSLWLGTLILAATLIGAHGLAAKSTLIDAGAISLAEISRLSGSIPDHLDRAVIFIIAALLCAILVLKRIVAVRTPALIDLESNESRSPHPDADPRRMPGRRRLNEALRQAESANASIAVVLLKLIRIKRRQALDPGLAALSRVEQLARRIQAGAPELVVTRLDRDLLAIAFPGMTMEQAMTKLHKTLPWAQLCDQLGVDLRLGTAEYPQDCAAIHQLIPRAAACLQPWTGRIRPG